MPNGDRWVRNGRAIRGVVAVAERPDGSRVTFRHYPLPIYKCVGRLRRRVNMLVDITGAPRRRGWPPSALPPSSSLPTNAIASKDLDGIVTSWKQAAEQDFRVIWPRRFIAKSIKTIIPLELHGEEDNVLEARARRPSHRAL